MGNADCVTLLRLAALSLTEGAANGMDDALSFAKTLEEFSRNLMEKRQTMSMECNGGSENSNNE